MLGFNATRPDNDKNTGPDVLWIDDELLALMQDLLLSTSDGRKTKTLQTEDKWRIGKIANRFSSNPLKKLPNY